MEPDGWVSRKAMMMEREVVVEGGNQRGGGRESPKLSGLASRGLVRAARSSPAQEWLETRHYSVLTLRADIGDSVSHIITSHG